MAVGVLPLYDGVFVKHFLLGCDGVARHLSEVIDITFGPHLLIVESMPLLPGLVAVGVEGVFAIVIADTDNVDVGVGGVVYDVTVECST